MAKKFYRRTENQNTQDINSIQSQLYDLISGGQRNMEIGPVLTILGDLAAAAVHVGIGVQLKVFNGGGAVSYVKFGGSGVLAPTGPADGIPVPAGEYIFVCSGEDDYIIAEAASTVFGYKINGETQLVLTKTE